MSNPFGPILEALSQSRRILITTHVRPDGDALGTAAAMVLGLTTKGKSCEVLLLSHLPSKYAFVFKDNSIVYHDVENGWPEPAAIDQFDTLLVVDTGTWSQLPGLQERFANFKGHKLVMDHHLTQEDWADISYVNTKAAAAGEIAASLLEAWGVEFDKPLASALFLAIASDTGWFHFSSTRPHTLRLAARLMEAGVDTDQMYRLLYQNERAERIALQTRAQQSLELMADNRLAVMRISKEDFKASGAGFGDTENVINIPLQIRTVEVSVMFVEQPTGGPIRVSLRSKGKIDVANFCQEFGGGGHARAAGLKLEGTLNEVHDRVVEAMKRRLQV